MNDLPYNIPTKPVKLELKAEDYKYLGGLLMAYAMQQPATWDELTLMLAVNPLVDKMQSRYIKVNRQKEKEVKLKLQPLEAVAVYRVICKMDGEQEPYYFALLSSITSNIHKALM